MSCKRYAYNVLLAVLVSLTIPVDLYPQEKTVGGALAYNEFSVCFGFGTGPDSSVRTAINLDMTGVLSGKVPYPGVSADVVYAFRFASRQTRNGEQISGIAGPGITLGYVRNEEWEYGITAALCGMIGLEYEFNVPVTLSLSFEPSIGIHLNKTENDFVKMDFYTLGAFWSILPHIGIRYRF